MLVLGIVLVLVALVAIGYMWFGTQGQAPLAIDLGAFEINLTPLQLFLLGAACLVVLFLGLVLTLSGMRRQAKRRREVKDLRHQVRAQDTVSGRDADRREDRGDDRRDGDRVDDDRREDRLTRDRSDADRRDADRRGADRLPGDRADGDRSDQRTTDYERELPPPPPPSTTGREVPGQTDPGTPGEAPHRSDIDPSRFRP